MMFNLASSFSSDCARSTREDISSEAKNRSVTGKDFGRYIAFEFSEPLSGFGEKFFFRAFRLALSAPPTNIPPLSAMVGGWWLVVGADRHRRDRAEQAAQGVATQGKVFRRRRRGLRTFEPIRTQRSHPRSLCSP